MRARLAVSVSIATACGRSVLGDLPGEGDTTSAESSDTVQDPLTGGDPSGQPPPVDTTVQTTLDDDDVTTEPPDPSGPVDTGWIPDFSSACGNGELGAGEECDDGNYEDGDGCSSSCTIPFEVSWTVSHDGGASGFDAAYDVVIDGAGNIIVAGDSSEPGQGRNVWVQQYLPDGTEGWTFQWNGLDDLDDTAHAIDITADGDFVVAGSTESSATGDDILAMRIDSATLTAEWTFVVDGPGSGPEDYDDADEAAAVIVDSDGDIVVGGRVRVGPSNWDVWVRRTDGQGAEQSTQTFDGPVSGEDGIRSLTFTTDGVLRGLADLETEDGVLGAVVWFDDSDMIGEIYYLDTRGAAIAVSSVDAYVIAGYDSEDQGFETDYDIRSYASANHELQWASLLDSANDDDEAHGIAIGVGDMAFVVGESGRDGQQENGRLYAIDASGFAWWGDEHNAEADLRDAFLGVAVDPFGDVVVVGLESVIGQQTNALVGKYHPL